MMIFTTTMTLEITVQYVVEVAYTYSVGNTPLTAGACTVQNV